MPSFLSKFLIVLACLQAVSGIEEKVVNVTKRANGPINAVYFTNWFVALHTG
jgi:hypothetical protein